MKMRDVTENLSYIDKKPSEPKPGNLMGHPTEKKKKKKSKKFDKKKWVLRKS